MFQKFFNSCITNSVNSNKRKILLKYHPELNGAAVHPQHDRLLFTNSWWDQQQQQKCLLIKSKLNIHHINNNRCLANIPPSEDLQQVSALNIKKTLKQFSNDSEDGFCCIKTTCPVCKPNESLKISNKTNTVFINKTTGTLVCPACNVFKNWNEMEKFFIKPTTTKMIKDIEIHKQQFLNMKTKSHTINIELPASVKLVEQLTEKEFNSIIYNLNLESIPKIVFDNLKLLCDPITNSLYFEIKNVNGNCVGYKQLPKTNDGIIEQVLLPLDFDNKCFGVILQLTTKPPKEAIIVLNLIDYLALNSHKLNATIICLPYGHKSLPQECLPSLERFSKLTLWFDHTNIVDWDMAISFSKKIDEKRCLFVRPTELHPPPFEAHKQNIDFRLILQKAQPIMHKAITTFTALRQDVLSELQNIEKVQGIKWQRYPVLNKLLKGHRKGELTILTGPTGCGKTTFMSEYSLDLAMQGVTTLWGSFEIRNVRLATTLLRQLAGHPFDNQQLIEFDNWANQFEQLPMYFMTFHGQQSIKIVMDTIEHAQYVHDIHHVIIDNVQFMMGTSDEPKHIDRFWRQDAIIAAFRTFATKKNCHVTLVIHPRKERDTEDLTTSSIFGGAKATQEADNVLIIQDKRLTAIRGKKYLQIAKNRYSGDLGIMPLEFDKAGLSYAPKKTIKKIDDKNISTNIDTS